jgi:hypothetical protein
MKYMEQPWSFEHAVDCPVSHEFVWKFWTQVSNWILDPDIESVELDGPFASGSKGVTLSRSSGKIEWQLASVEPGRSATMELTMPGAIGRFRWTFAKSGSGTRIVQHVSIDGPHAQDFVHVMAPNLENGIPLGMEKLCRKITEAAG